jgi:hypothetical protein
MVRRQSIQAVKMIEECFASKERRVQAMTGEGTVLDSIQFRNEVKKHVKRKSFFSVFIYNIDFCRNQMMIQS